MEKKRSITKQKPQVTTSSLSSLPRGFHSEPSTSQHWNSLLNAHVHSTSRTGNCLDSPIPHEPLESHGEDDWFLTSQSSQCSAETGRSINNQHAT